MIPAKPVVRAGAVLGTARTLVEAAAVAALPPTRTRHLVEGPDAFEVLEPTIVKVQAPLGDRGPALIYDEARRSVVHVPLAPDLAFKLRGRPKAFFYARRAPGGWHLEEEAPWQTW